MKNTNCTKSKCKSKKHHQEEICFVEIYIVMIIVFEGIHCRPANYCIVNFTSRHCLFFESCSLSRPTFFNRSSHVKFASFNPKQDKVAIMENVITVEYIPKSNLSYQFSLLYTSLSRRIQRHFYSHSAHLSMQHRQLIILDNPM